MAIKKPFGGEPCANQSPITACVRAHSLPSSFQDVQEPGHSSADKRKPDDTIIQGCCGALKVKALNLPQKA